jgi:hypothetical protein
MGHGVAFTHKCAGEIVSAFLKAPLQKPNATCLADSKQIPDFVLDRRPPPIDPFIEMKTYGDSGERRSK